MAEMTDTSKPDFKIGFPADNLPDCGMVAGQADGEDVILVRRGDEFFALGAFCTHYHGPLADGLLVDDTVRCPWHHACFSLRTGEALRAPALDPVACWRVEKAGDTIYVGEKLGQAAAKLVAKPAKGTKAAKAAKSKKAPASVVIVGGGAAGLAAADMLSREGYDGPLTMISADDSPPYDRPNLSKDFLAGKSQDDWIPLRLPQVLP
jgi:nitrite reductase/ring-hydroxylating ferredoxin subunit